MYPTWQHLLKMTDTEVVDSIAKIRTEGQQDTANYR